MRKRSKHVVYQKKIWSIILPLFLVLIIGLSFPVAFSFSPTNKYLKSSQQNLKQISPFSATLQSSEDSNEAISSPSNFYTTLEKMPIWKCIQLAVASSAMAVLLISWEDLSMSHPMRQYTASQPLESTVRGMAFGQRERQSLLMEYEPAQSQPIPSYNEVMLKHRTERVPTWDGPITKDDVQHSVATIQRAVLFIDECKSLATNYEWETLSENLRNPILHAELEKACGILKRADGFLSDEARDVVGFDWGSCAWRHCGAFADAEEAIDELDHLIGILEPFEGLFILDIVERSFRDMLAVTQTYADQTIVIPDYNPLARMSDASAESEGTLDADYLAALEFLRQIED